MNPRRKIRPRSPWAALDLVRSAAEHDGEPYPELEAFRSHATATWRMGPRALRVKVLVDRTLVGHFDRTPGPAFRGTFEVGPHGSLIEIVRDGIDWLRGLDLDPPPIPFPEPESESEA